MGSEHSSHLQNPQRSESLSSNRKQPTNMTNIRRQHTIANPAGAAASELSEMGEFGRPGSISPGPSVCSDTDLPYISYTVNRPIGDSPKLTNKQQAPTKKRTTKVLAKSAKNKSAAPAHSVVVVKSALSAPNVDKDPDIVRLHSIPMFLPIMRATLNLPAARDPEVLERLDPVPLHKLCVKYQNHLTSCANLVATEQNSLTTKIREVDGEITKLRCGVVDKQKKFAKYAEKFGKVTELSHQLNRCHMMLNQTLESMETLNGYLDIEDRLEPFVWTTG